MTTADSPNPAVAAVLPARAAPTWMTRLLPPATIIVILVSAVLLLMTPLWMHGAVGSTATFFATPDQAREASDPTVHDLLFGGDFYIDVGDGHQLFTPSELAHLRDARLVLYVFLGLALVSLVFLTWMLITRRREARTWGGIARGGAILVIATIVLGVFALVAFDTAFELFHRIFFPGGNWAFPPDSWLIRLYPFAFWELTSVGLGILLVMGGSLAWFIGRRKAARLEARP